MTATDIVLPVIQWTVTLLIITLLLFGVYKILSLVGFFKLFKKKKKVNQKDMDVVIEIMSEKNTFQEFAEFIGKFPFEKQKDYLNAYYQIKDIQKEIEGRK